VSTASTAAEETLGAAACGDCLRRSRLLGQLSAVLDRNCRADGRLFELLALGDEQLIAALGGRRREQLRREHAQALARARSPAGSACATCVHDSRYPESLRKAARVLAMPPLLHVSGGLDRLRELAHRPAVAMLGSPQPSAYGQTVARRLGRELAASGIVVVTQRVAGVAFAAQQGALDAGGATLLVAGDGLDVPTPRGRHATYEALSRRGCSVSELPPQTRGRTWGAAAGVRTAVALSALAVIVEAREDPRDLRGAELARLLGRTVAALPGQVDSPASTGCHALLRDGARLVRGSEDVLDLLYGVDAGPRDESPARAEMPWLGARQRELVQHVGEGVDTIGGLAGTGRDPGEVLQALSELELLGLLVRIDPARYAVASPAAARMTPSGPGGAMPSRGRARPAP
jgi:DNA processing protein